MSSHSLRSEEIKKIAEQFAIDGEVILAKEIEVGLINSTWVVSCQPDSGLPQSYILQRINESVFGDPLDVMQNVERVTQHINAKVLRAKKDFGGHTLSLYPGRNGKSSVTGAGGGIWRCYNFIEGCRTYDVVENTRQAYQAGHAFGSFQNLVGDFEPSDLIEVIPDFHHTPKRYQQLLDAVKNDKAGRIADVTKELATIESMEGEMGRLVDLAASGELPLRVTHNDTKINNVLFDIQTDEAVCVIDLDTVMPGLSLYDFGDLIRTSTNPAVEGETDLSQVVMRMPIFEALVEGYLTAAGEVLTALEISLLAFSGRLISLELAMRFLTDYLNGDCYFRTSYPRQNLDRARVQLKLAQEIGQNEKAMNDFVKKLTT